MKEMKKLDRRGVSPEKASSTKRSRSKAGVSPVIATILLILIAIAAGVIIYTYTIGFLGTAGPSTGQGEMNVDIATLSDLSGDDNMTLYLRNTGGISLTLQFIYVTNLTDGTVRQFGFPSGFSVDDLVAVGDNVVAPSAVVELHLEGSPGALFNAGRDFQIQIVAEDGTTFTRTYRAS